MKNKTFACVMGLVLALSLTACGEEEVIVENTNEEVSVEVQTQEATEAPTETVAETDGYRSRGRSPVTGGSYGDPGSEWYRMELCRRYDRWC